MIAISRTLMLQKPAVDIAARIISVSTGPSKMEDLISKEEEERDVSSAFNMVPEIFSHSCHEVGNLHNAQSHTVP